MILLMKVDPVRPNSSAKPGVQIVHPVQWLAAASKIPGSLANLAPRRRRAGSNRPSLCAHLICRKQHNFFASTRRGYDSAPKRERSQAPKSGGAGSSSRMTLSTMSDRSMLLLGKRCK